MKTESLRLIVLIPHRDALKSIGIYRRRLFENGFSGAYSFPGVIPLIITKNPYTPGELKQTTLFLRNLVSGGHDGWFTSKTPEIMDSLPGISLGGLSFDISLAGLELKDGAAALPRPFLGITVLNPGEEEPYLRFSAAVPPPPVSFRAAAAANLVYGIPGTCSCIWEIGHPVWLSPYKRTRDG